MLCASDIYKSYRDPVLRGVSLQAKSGEIVAIAGANGSGKSTLLSIITSILPPDKGIVTIDDKPITPTLIKANMGYVAQENALFENLSVKENIKFWASVYGVRFDASKYHKDFLGKKAKNLSGGMKKRLSIIIALLNNPNYLIMDEPTAALDLFYKESVMDTIRYLKASGKSVIFTSHNASELMVCDRIYILKDGMFVYSGSPQDISDDNGLGKNLLAIIKDDNSRKEW